MHIDALFLKDCWVSLAWRRTTFFFYQKKRLKVYHLFVDQTTAHLFRIRRTLFVHKKWSETILNTGGCNVLGLPKSPFIWSRIDQTTDDWPYCPTHTLTEMHCTSSMITLFRWTEKTTISGYTMPSHWKQDRKKKKRHGNAHIAHKWPHRIIVIETNAYSQYEILKTTLILIGLYSCCLHLILHLCWLRNNIQPTITTTAEKKKKNEKKKPSMIYGSKTKITENRMVCMLNSSKY